MSFRELRSECLPAVVHGGSPTWQSPFMNWGFSPIAPPPPSGLTEIMRALGYPGVVYMDDL